MVRRTWGWTMLLLSCSGTDTGNPPVIDLQTSACRERYGETKSIGSVLQSLAPDITRDPLYDGLTCFVWQRGPGDALTISITNYDSGCGAEVGWSPRVETAADGALELVLQDRDCSIARCGSCVYDVTFTVDAEELWRDREVRLFERGCETSPKSLKRATLPLGRQANGAVCTYTHYYALQGLGSTGGGHPRATCAARQMGAPDVACPEDYVCTDLGEPEGSDFSKGKRCLASCTGDADCDELSRCEAGVCKLSATGLTTSSTDGAR